MKTTRWIEDPAQKIWLPIALLFALFYFGEAILFWGPNPRVNAPALLWPIAYWGAFGGAILFLLNRQAKNRHPRLSAVPAKLETITLGIAITAAVIGIPFLIITTTGNITLGHIALLGIMFQAAAIIGGMSGNLGWLLASILWLATAVFIFFIPQKQDYTLGISIALGFAAIGFFRKCARTTTKNL